MRSWNFILSTFANLENTRDRPLITPPSWVQGWLEEPIKGRTCLWQPPSGAGYSFLIESNRSRPPIFLHHQSKKRRIPPSFFPFFPEANNVPSAPTVDGSTQERTRILLRCWVRLSSRVLHVLLGVGTGNSGISKGWVF